MRKAIPVLALVLVCGPLRSETHKTPPADVGAGRIAWFDITTTDLARSKEFYGKLFDWQFAPVAGTDQAAEIVSGGTSIGTLRVADGKISGYNGVVYVQVTDIRASCKKATELGGTVAPGFPFNLPDGVGAIAVFADPVRTSPGSVFSNTARPGTTFGQVEAFARPSAINRHRSFSAVWAGSGPCACLLQVLNSSQLLSQTGNQVLNGECAG